MENCRNYDLINHWSNELADTLELCNKCNSFDELLGRYLRMIECVGALYQCNLGRIIYNHRKEDDKSPLHWSEMIDDACIL